MTAAPGIQPIAAQDAPVRRALLDLNNAHARETSHLTPEGWRTLLDGAYAATCLGGSAFLIAFDQAAAYDSPNFRWFRDRYARFVYIDRVIVADGSRGRGMARRLCLNLFDTARRAGHGLVVCEVNLVPPNPASDAFHARMAFREVGRARLGSGDKTVRYLAKQLEADAVTGASAR